ncbi:MAG: hypothetical protein Q4C78_06140 [Synergistaceae bacterium]|nr:hypothetical protein [Synergistaceae bacterium]
MASLLHLTEYRSTQTEVQEKKIAIDEQISIFKSISLIFYIAIVVNILLVVYLLCYVRAPKMIQANIGVHQNFFSHRTRLKNTMADQSLYRDSDLQNLAFEIEENEYCLLEDPYNSQERLFSNGKVLLVSPPHVIYKGYYFDSSTKTAIIEVEDSNTQLFIREKQKFYSGTALLLKIKKEEIVWKWQGNIYVTKIG